MPSRYIVRKRREKDVPRPVTSRIPSTAVGRLMQYIEAVRTRRQVHLE